jgi:adenine-specific DNA-methyltransferase
MDAAYANPDDDPRGPWKPRDYTCNKSAEERPNLYYSIVHPKTGEEIWPKRTRVWAYSQELHEHHVRENRLWWGRNQENKVPAYKRFLSEVGGVVAQTVWLWEDVGHTDESKKELKRLFSEAAELFDTPKPVKLIRKMLTLASANDQQDIILDFFAGSGTTAQVVLELNKEDGGNRKFILVQLPEPTGREDYPTIADITKERVRRVIQKLNKEDDGKLPLNGGQKPDRGFRVVKLAESNFKTWNANVPTGDVAALQQQLELHINHLRDGRTAEDLLYEILLKSGFPLTTPVEVIKLPPHPVSFDSAQDRPLLQGERGPDTASKTVYSAAGGALFICLERELSLDLIRAMAERKPERVVCLDDGFAGNDQLKANAVQIFKTKGVTSFRTV